jgi:voltage-gated potassium channel
LNISIILNFKKEEELPSGNYNMLVSIKIFKKFILLLLLILLILGIGTVGYIAIEGWNFFDSFYMTIITMATVGFGEVHELSNLGRGFTAFLIISCFGIFAFTISSITSYVVSGEYRRDLRTFKTRRKMSNMENHVIICGYGRVGRQVAEEMKLYGKPYIIIEKDASVIIDNENLIDAPFIKGDPTKEGVLESVKIDHALALISCLPMDTDNLYTILTARELNQNLKIVSRASSTGAVSKLKLAGADQVIMPDAIGGTHMASIINNPDIIEFMDAIRIQGNSGVNLEAITYEEILNNSAGLTIQDLQTRFSNGAKIIGYKKPNGAYEINPDGGLIIQPGSKLFLLGTTKQLDELNQYIKNA